jgi:formate dehydrogenase
MGRCQDAATCEIGHAHVDPATPKAVLEAAHEGRTHAAVPDYEAVDAYRAGSDYEALERLRAGGDWEAVQAQVQASGLRGLGGAGFPSGTR